MTGDATQLLNSIDQLVSLPPSKAKLPDPNGGIVQALKRIGEIIVDACRFYTEDDAEIIPLWVEAYYCNPKQGYEDPTADDYWAFHGRKSKGQVNHYGFLYHRGGKGNYRRVDLVLSRSPDYALSFLLKAACIRSRGTSKNLKQTKVHDELSGSKRITLFVSKPVKQAEEIPLRPSTRVFAESEALKNDMSEEAKIKRYYMALPDLAVFRFAAPSRKEDCQPRTNYNRLFG